MIGVIVGATIWNAGARHAALNVSEIVRLQESVRADRQISIRSPGEHSGVPAGSDSIDERIRISPRTKVIAGESARHTSRQESA
jgi:hypothetical protein